jgi:hypothetical protein
MYGTDRWKRAGSEDGFTPTALPAGAVTGVLGSTVLRYCLAGPDMHGGDDT